MKSMFKFAQIKNPKRYVIEKNTLREIKTPTVGPVNPNWYKPVAKRHSPGGRGGRGG
jgi:hypothetical protein